jgi:hypothetical protein
MAGRYDPYDFGNNQPIVDPNASLAAPAAPAALPASQTLTKNPQLSQTPLGAYTDSQYEAAAAQLRAQIQRQYADILQQLGYKDDSGNFIPGSVEADAQKQKAELQRSMGIAGEEVTQQHQREGTLFSGLRGINQGRAEHPFVSALADLDTNTPLQLSKLYDQATGLTDEYTLQNNLLLADAAARAAAGFGTQPGQVITPPGSPAPTYSAGDVIPAAPVGSTPFVTGGTGSAGLGGIATGDPEANAFAAGTSDVSPFAVSSPINRTTAGVDPNAAALRALRLRSQGMNKLYGLG